MKGEGAKYDSVVKSRKAFYHTLKDAAPILQRTEGFGTYFAEH